MLQEVTTSVKGLSQVFMQCDNDTVQDVVGFVNRKEAILAGGSLRRYIDQHDTLSDIDLFFYSEKGKMDCVEFFDTHYKNIFRCPEGKLFSYVDKNKLKIQIIGESYYPTAYDCINSFDLTPCMAAWDGSKLMYDIRMPTDVVKKKLRINKIDYPAATLKRIEKYVRKGYSLPSEEAMKLVDLIRLPNEVDNRVYID